MSDFKKLIEAAIEVQIEAREEISLVWDTKRPSWVYQGHVKGKYVEIHIEPVTLQKTPDREVYLIINNKEVGEYPTKALAIQKLKKIGYNVVPPMRGFE